MRKTDIATGKVQEFEWDYRNRLVKVTDKNNTSIAIQQVEFTYDAFNRRIAKEVDTTPLNNVDEIVTHFVYNADDIYLEFFDNDGATGTNQPTLSQRYLHGLLVDQVLAQDNGNSNAIWILTDHLGTVRDLVNNSGAVANHLVYDSFGRLISETNPSVDTRYLYTGREFDEEMGIYYYRARYYDPATGRFIGEDPLSFAGGDTNLYGYVVNNPMILVDPLGLSPCNCNGSNLANALGNTAKGIDANQTLPQRYGLEPRRGDTITGIRDTQAGRISNSTGKPVGEPLVRFDQPHKGSPFPHINLNPSLTGSPDPHIRISPTTLRIAGGAARTLEVAGRVARPIAIASDAYRLIQAYNDDGGCFGQNFRKTSGSVAGGWAGAFAGAWGGAQLGAAIGVFGGPVGAGVGGFIGGLVGGIGGAFGGSALGEYIAR